MAKISSILWGFRQRVIRYSSWFVRLSILVELIQIVLLIIYILLYLEYLIRIKYTLINLILNMDGYNDKTEGPNSDILGDPKYFDLQIRQTHYARGSDSTAQEISSKNIPFEYWNINSTKYGIFLSNSTKNLKFLWPKFDDYFIRSNYNSDNYEIFEINFNKWKGSAWKSDNEMESIFSKNYLEVGIVSTYFDFNNYDNPVQYLLK